MTSSGGGLGRADVARCWAGFASLGAGLIHLAVTQEHFEEWWLFGVFFLSVGAAQIGWAALALQRDQPPIPRLTAAANLAAVALWGVTRTVGLPVGPEPWTPEAVGRADVLCSVLEVGVAGALVAALWFASSDRRRSPDRPRTGRLVAAMFAGALAVAAVTTPALADTPAGGSAHGHAE